MPDLRGDGGSSKPETTTDHVPYSKRAMARDQIALMDQLGIEQIAVVGHDRGGRVAYRMALDHPDRVSRISVLDILPTIEHFQRTNMAFAMAYFHWFFLAQPAPMPETLIGANPDAYYFPGNRHLFAPEALAEYLTGCYDPAQIHAMCEDYRAAATYDCDLDRQDQEAGRTIDCPVQALVECAARSARFTTCSMSGNPGRRICAARRWSAATTSPRSNLNPPLQSCWRSLVNVGALGRR